MTRNSIRVLLVDDCRPFLEAAAHLLAEDPMIAVVGCVLSTREALERIPALRPDVVLMELAMPEISGLLATLHINAMPDAPRVIMVTDHDEPIYRSLAESVQVAAFVSKRHFGPATLTTIKDLFMTAGSSASSENGSHDSRRRP